MNLGYASMSLQKRLLLLDFLISEVRCCFCCCCCCCCCCCFVVGWCFVVVVVVVVFVVLLVLLVVVAAFNFDPALLSFFYFLLVFVLVPLPLPPLLPSVPLFSLSHHPPGAPRHNISRPI